MGNLLVVPIEDSLLYVQPLYLQSDQTQLPQLKRVIVFYRAPALTAVGAATESARQVVAMEPTLGEALVAAFGQSFSSGNAAGGGQVNGGGTTAAARAAARCGRRPERPGAHAHRARQSGVRRRPDGAQGRRLRRVRQPDQGAGAGPHGAPAPPAAVAGKPL